MKTMQFTKLSHAITGSLLLFFASCTLKDDSRESGIIDETENIVAGQVFDEQGHPLQGATVSLYETTVRITNSQYSLAKSIAALPDVNMVETKTDEDGRYQIQCDFQKNAYLQVSWRDSLGLLDSVDFSKKSEYDLGKQSLKEKGWVSITTTGLQPGTLIWIPSLNVELVVEESDSLLSMKAPPCVLVFILIVEEEQVGSVDEIIIESGEETQVEIPSIIPANITDSRDQKKYSITKIGSQVWMAENLNFGTLVTTSSVIQSVGGKNCQGNLESNCLEYGGLYQWHVAMNLPDSCADHSCASLVSSVHQGICPDGWHIPNQDEITLLAETLGGVSIAGSKMKRNDVGLASWDAVLYNDGNSSGFSALPSGSRYFNGTFAYSISHARRNATWWQTEEDLSTEGVNAWLCGVSDEDSSFRSVNVYSKKDALSVRCIQDQ